MLSKHATVLDRGILRRKSQEKMLNLHLLFTLPALFHCIYFLMTNNFQS